jgi:type 1 fimbria pilin
MKKLMVFAILFAFAAFAASNVFHVTFQSDAWIGANQVKAGDYKVSVDDGKVTFKSGKTVIEVPGKIETAEHKFATTGIVIVTVAERPQVKEIEIGGSASRIVFENTSIPTGGE